MANNTHLTVFSIHVGDMIILRASLMPLEPSRTSAKGMLKSTIPRHTINIIFRRALFVSGIFVLQLQHYISQLIEQINAAKGRLRTILHRGLFKPVKELLKASCKCKEKTMFGFIEALDGTGVWPLDEVWHKKPVEEILDSLDAFSYDPAAKHCRSCRKNYNFTVKSAVNMTRKYFDGLCLDCMDRSKPKTRDEDSDYWQHNKLRPGEWDHNCRVNHGQPTWYFSFMGRKARRDYLNDVGRGRRR